MQVTIRTKILGIIGMFTVGFGAFLIATWMTTSEKLEHSDYRADPWGRLQRTAEFLAFTTFGTAEQAEVACARVRAVHQRVVGRAADGRAYAATDPHLLEWVHLAEVESF